MRPRHALQPSDPEVAQVMRELYPEHPTDEVARVLRTTVKRIYQLATLLGLKKTEAYLSGQAGGRIQRGSDLGAFKLSRFKPGHQPWNKGVPFHAGGASVATRFQPGQMPHTWMPVGSLRISGGQLERKVAETPGPNHLRWTPVARLVWEAAHGPVPAGHLVVFKPGMKTTVLEQITLDRVECISRAENARRNVQWNRHPEVAHLMHLRGQITRQVNRLQRQANESQGAKP